MFDLKHKPLYKARNRLSKARGIGNQFSVDTRISRQKRLLLRFPTALTAIYYKQNPKESQRHESGAKPDCQIRASVNISKRFVHKTGFIMYNFIRFSIIMLTPSAENAII